MSTFTIAVQADQDDAGSNHIEVSLATNPPRMITLDTNRGDSLDVLDEEEFGPADEALYYAVERIAKLEADNAKLRLQYAGAVGLLVDVRNEFDHGDSLERIEPAVDDWCDLSGWSCQVKYGSMSLIAPDGEQETS